MWNSSHTYFILQPHVDFGLKLIGADLMSIPGLYRFVQVQHLSAILEVGIKGFFNFSSSTIG